MTIRKFLTSVADVYAYGDNDEILFTGKTLVDSSIEVTLGSSPIRGGVGNQLLYTYYHTAEMNFTLTDTQWNLGMLAATAGEDVNTSTNAYTEASVVLTSTTGASMASGVTPLAFNGSGTIYGWAKDVDGDWHRVTFTSGTPFTFATMAEDGSPVLGEIGDYVCVRFYALNSAAQYIDIKANMIPKVVKLVIEAQLNSSDVTSNKIGKVQIISPKVTLSGGFTISMTADGSSNTPLTGMALSYNGPTGTDACANEPYYARIVEIIDSANWYDNVIGLSIAGGDFEMAQSDTETLKVWAVPTRGSAFLVDNADLTFALVGTPTATGTTVGANTGVVTSLAAAGEAVVSATITSKTDIDTTVTVTVA